VQTSHAQRRLEPTAAIARSHSNKATAGRPSRAGHRESLVAAFRVRLALAGRNPYRLVVGTSRCGRDNPGLTPGEDIAREARVGVARRNWGRPEVGIPTWRTLAAPFPHVAGPPGIFACRATKSESPKSRRSGYSAPVACARACACALARASVCARVCMRARMLARVPPPRVGLGIWEICRVSD
jgi:hypothetical protein